MERPSNGGPLRFSTGVDCRRAELLLPSYLAHLINTNYTPTECFWPQRLEHAKQVQGHEARSQFQQDKIHTELYRIEGFADKYPRMVTRLKDKISDMQRYVDRLQSRQAYIYAKWAAHGSHNRGRLLCSHVADDASIFTTESG